MRIIDRLCDLSGSYDALFCDIWGCVHDGLSALPEAVAALRDWRARGGLVALVTNSPRPQGVVAEQLARLGVPSDAYDAIATSGDAAQAAMARGVAGRRVWHLGPPQDSSFFTRAAPDIGPIDTIARVPFEAAEGIVATGLFDDGDSPEAYRPTLEAAAARGLPLLCANPDIVVDLGPRRIFCAGALAALYTELGGRSLYFGKPHLPIYALARARLAALGGAEMPTRRILAVGDGVATDVEGARRLGIDCLFVSGGLAARDVGTDPAHPDPERLRGWLASAGAAPALAIGMLR
ncbi:MAG: TIGR01459 family HAD-type hydrolase [Alphaproteobacteria bacterium]|nr:TIGR01459 family HAD-type hydrolase [Alphaproteobacteria bacterium]